MSKGMEPQCARESSPVCTKHSIPTGASHHYPNMPAAMKALHNHTIPHEHTSHHCTYVGLFCLLRGSVVMAFGFVGFALRLAVILRWVERCFGSWGVLGLFCLLRVTRRKLQMPGNAEEHKNKKHLQSTQSAQPINLTDQAPITTERTAFSV